MSKTVAKKILFIALILKLTAANASFDNFASPNKKTQITKTLIKKPVTKKEKTHKIKSAIIWQVPDRDFLAKKLSKEEELLIEKQALERFIEAASQKDPELYDIYRSSRKNTELLEGLTGIVAQNSKLSLINNYIDDRNDRREEQKKLVASEIRRISKLYQRLKAQYQVNKKHSSQEYQDIKTQITECCGLENFIYVESLLKREINFEVFNT